MVRISKVWSMYGRNFSVDAWAPKVLSWPQCQCALDSPPLLRKVRLAFLWWAKMVQFIWTSISLVEMAVACKIYKKKRSDFITLLNMLVCKEMFIDFMRTRLLTGPALSGLVYILYMRRPVNVSFRKCYIWGKLSLSKRNLSSQNTVSILY